MKGRMKADKCLVHTLLKEGVVSHSGAGSQVLQKKIKNYQKQH